MATSFDVVGLGALNVDKIYAVPRLIRDGGEKVIGTAVAAGGCAANTVYGLAKLGLQCGFVGAVGDDPEGQVIAQSFAEVGVDTSHVVMKPGRTTGTVLCLTDTAGRRAMYLQPGANLHLTEEDIDWEYLSSARLLHLSSFAGDELSSLQNTVAETLPKATRMSLSLDALYVRRGLAALSRLVRRCSVLFANHSELKELTKLDVRPAARACLDLGCEAVVVTFGRGFRPAGWEGVVTLPGVGSRNGVDVACYIASQAGEWTVPAIDTHQRPTIAGIGAGDAFAAGFLWALLSGWSLPSCGSLGHTTAGYCLSALDARTGLPTRQDLLKHHGWYFPEPSTR